MYYVRKMLYLVKDPLYRSFRYDIFLKYGFTILKMEHKFFPDGETYIRFLDDIDPEGYYLVIIRGYPEQDRNIIRALFILETLKDLGARKIYLCLPYMPYSRQDKRFLPGEAISAQIIARTILDRGADIIITIDVHNEAAYHQLNNRFVNIRSTDLWCSYIRKNLPDRDICIISPDIGRKGFIKELGEKCNATTLSFMKVRDPHTGKILHHEPEDPDAYRDVLKNRDTIIIIDDIIATGGTVAGVARRIRRDGFQGKIYTFFTHGLFLGNAYDKLMYAGVDHVICTDTVDNPFIHEDVCVGKLILNFLEKKGLLPYVK